MPDPTPVELLSFIKEAFDWEELESLCFQLYIQFDDIAGQTREAKARELISYMQRVGRLPDLVAALARERPEKFAATFREEPELPIKKPQPRARDSRQVFIIHAHQDAEFAQRLAGDLRRAGYEVWIAPDSIPFGERWVEAINRALQESGIFLLVSTGNAVDSAFVQDETNYAIELAAKSLIRFIRLDIQEADVPPLWTIRQHISFRKGYKLGIRKLLLALEEPTSGPKPPAEQKTSQTTPRNLFYLVLGGLVIAAVIFLGWRLMANGTDGNSANLTTQGSGGPPESTNDFALVTTFPSPTLRPAPTDTPEPSRTPTITPPPLPKPATSAPSCAATSKSSKSTSRPGHS